MSYHRDYLDFDTSIMDCNLIGEGVDTKKRKIYLLLTDILREVLRIGRRSPLEDMQKLSKQQHPLK